jgi:hypothetical protein
MSIPNDWFEALRQMRRRWVDAAQENKFERGIWNATVEKYADPAHFVFELLQNAEDQGASRTAFRLLGDRIEFEHDGTGFSPDDVDGITGIGNTTKLGQANKIGCFGIGFKSVFVITDRPEIHTNIDGEPLAFAIDNLVVPERITFAGMNGLTTIVLPLREQRRDETISAVRSQLQKSGPRSMLFLDNVRSVSWIDASGAKDSYSIARDRNGVATLSSEARGAQSATHYLLLGQQVPNEDKNDRLAVKIAFRLGADGKIVREDEPTQLAVFFETEEKTGLYFHLHGPFELTDNRANIKRGNAWNDGLVRQASSLLAGSLPQLRDRGLVNRSLLGVMPNLKDALAAPWDDIRTAVVAAFKAEALTPAQFGGHAPSTTLVRGPSDLREVLGDEGLQALRTDATPRRWSISGSQKNDREDNFLASLEIPEWGPTELSSAVASGLGYAPRSAAKAWLAGLSDEQIRKFYLVLDAANRSRGLHSLAHCAIVKLENGSLVRPSLALLPPTDGQGDDDVEASTLSIVKSTLIQSPRGSRKDIVDFLRRLGVQPIGERQYLQAIVRRHHTDPKGAERGHLKAMRRFLKWWEEHKDVTPFAELAFVRAEGVAGFVRVERIYVDTPFKATDLSVIYDGQTQGFTRLPLWAGYKSLKRELLLGFLKACGAQDRLEVMETTLAWEHPLRAMFSSGARRTGTGQNAEYYIPGIQALLARKDARISRLVWNAMAAAPQASLRAVYAPNQSQEVKSAASNVVQWLEVSSWIPTKDGRLRKPAEITVADLASGFTASGNEPWLTAIGFEEQQRRNVQRLKARRQAAVEIGLPVEVADHLERLSAVDREAVAGDLLRRLRAGVLVPPAFPERSSNNPVRRAERVAERATNADSKTYELKTRSMRTSDGEVRVQAKQYLADLYTNEDCAMVCQVCHQRMPFNLPNGEPYFEAVACIADEPRELSQNFLALCPTCAAKWKYANASSSDEIAALLCEATELSIDVTLAGDLMTIKFVEVHLADIVSTDPNGAAREAAASPALTS